MTQEKAGTGFKQYMVRVAWAAHRGASAETESQSSAIIRRLLPDGNFIMTESQPDIILFMSGGSERRAIELASSDRPVLLLCIRGNNAWAAATEVMAWMVAGNRVAVLADIDDPETSRLIDRWIRVAAACSGLRGTRAGLIGSVSEWLVASDVPAAALRDKIGTDLVDIPWSALPDYAGQMPDAKLTERLSGHDAHGLKEAAQVLTLLRQVAEEKNLDALAVECFSLVQKRKVTACLALAQLNTEGIPSACEGDLASMAGMMLVRAVTGKVPWMANTTRLTPSTVILSHCTAAFDFVSNIQLPTHYETGYSLAVSGRVDAESVTLLRLNDRLDRAFIASGRVAGHPRMSNACRTQVEIELPEEQINILRERPLGNHLLVLPDRPEEILRLLCRYKNIEVAN
jgi:L-fucose isomerase-like protein